MARKRTTPSPIQPVTTKTETNHKSCSKCSLSSKQDRYMNFQPLRGSLYCSGCHVHALVTPFLTLPAPKPITLATTYRVKHQRKVFIPTKPIGQIIGYYGEVAERKSYAGISL